MFNTDGVVLDVYGSWMNHAEFGLYDNSGSGVFGTALGDLTESRPTGTATWNGLMTGTPTAGPQRGDRLQGDAALTYRMGSGSLDASFTSIKNIDLLQSHSTTSIRFANVPVSASGTFSSGERGNRIEGGFYGPGQAEAAGVFERSGIVGAFGARKQ